jgi:TIGR03009 family protein
MDQSTRSVQAALVLAIWGLLSPVVCAQQLGAPQAYSPQQPYAPPANPDPTQQTPIQGQLGAPQQIAPPQPAAQMPPGFPLNALQQASLDQVLDAWQQQSGKIVNFSCAFDRLEYVPAFGPVINGQSAPLNKNKGQLTYSKPEKGSFEITKIFTYKEVPPPTNDPQAPKRGDWVEQAGAVGEHWVCDGKSVYEFRSDLKQVIERPLPPHAPGDALLDGPLPFLFGAESAKLKQRYWMKVDEQNHSANQIWLTAWPKFQEQAANFKQVDVILDRNLQLPQAMRVTMPNDDTHVYSFDIKNATVNGVFNRLQQAVFNRPHTPFGWKLVVQNPPVAQAAQPMPQTR